MQRQTPSDSKGYGYGIATEDLREASRFVCERVGIKRIRKFLIHHNAERNHQGIQNQLFSPAPPAPRGRALSSSRLGGLLNSHYRRSA
jgi:hypothetical protein